MQCLTAFVLAGDASAQPGLAVTVCGVNSRMQCSIHPVAAFCPCVQGSVLGIFQRPGRSGDTQGWGFLVPQGASILVSHPSDLLGLCTPRSSPCGVAMDAGPGAGYQNDAGARSHEGCAGGCVVDDEGPQGRAEPPTGRDAGSSPVPPWCLQGEGRQEVGSAGGSGHYLPSRARQNAEPSSPCGAGRQQHFKGLL